MQVLLSPRIGGAERLAETLQEEWKERGLAATTEFLFLSEPSSRMARLARLTRAVWRFRPDVIVSHSAIPNVYARLVPTRSKKVCVMHSASDDMKSRTLALAERLLRFRTDAIVAVSDEQLRAYAVHFPKPFREIRRVIPNGLSKGWRGKQQFRVAPREVVTVARVAWQKRPDLWREVVELAESRLPGINFIWWGPIDLADPNVLEAVAPSLPSTAKFAGATEEANEALLSADIMLSTSEREAHSIALLEARAAGLPCVVSDAVLKGTDPGVMTFSQGAQPGEIVAALEAILAAWPDYAAKALETSVQLRETHASTTLSDSYLALFSELRA